MTKLRNRAIGAVALAAAVIGPATTATAAGTVTITGTTRAGDTLTVTGGSSYTNQPLMTLGTDGTGDTALPVGPLGGDVVAASMATLTSGSVQLRWTVNELPPVTNGSPTGIVYGWASCVNESSCFAVTSQRVIGFPAQVNGGYDFWRCADPSCTPADWAYVSTGAATYDGPTKTITVTLTAGQISATPGATITPVAVSDQGPVFVGTGESLAGVLVSPGLDGVPEIDNFTVAAREVSVAVGAPGLDPASVTYPTTVTPATNGSYSTSTSVAGMSGAATVYARACFGANNCGYATQDISL